MGNVEHEVLVARLREFIHDMQKELSILWTLVSEPNNANSNIVYSNALEMRKDRERQEFLIERGDGEL